MVAERLWGSLSGPGSFHPVMGRAGGGLASGPRRGAVPTRSPGLGASARTCRACGRRRVSWCLRPCALRTRVPRARHGRSAPGTSRLAREAEGSGAGFWFIVVFLFVCFKETLRWPHGSGPRQTSFLSVASAAGRVCRHRPVFPGNRADGLDTPGSLCVRPRRRRSRAELPVAPVCFKM